MNNKKYENYMKAVLMLALRGKGSTSPNPMVGSIIVKKGQIVGRGYHKKAGTAHAEINALKDAKENAKGAELYVNLEPCCHTNRTGPCADEIIKSGIKRVIVGMEDPNPKVSGKGLEKLKKAGIEVVSGVLGEECQRLNSFFVKYIKTKTPYVILKMASSLDGKIASKTGDSKWITNERARLLVHKIRSEVDAILVGVDTVIVDDPILTVRGVKGSYIEPKSIILDSKLRIPETSKLLKSKDLSDIIVCTTKFAKKAKIDRFKKLGITVLVVRDTHGKVDVGDMLKELGKMEITSLMVEGGSKINSSFIDSKKIDKLMVFYSPIIIGGKGATPSVSGVGFDSVNNSLKLTKVKVRRIGDNILVEGFSDYVL